MTAPAYARIWRLELLPLQPGIESLDARLTETLDATFGEAQRRAGPWLACRAGCSECCFGPFPITQLDAWRLRRGLEVLRREQPARAAAVEARAREQATVMMPEFPGDPVTGLIDEEDGGEAEQRFAERFAPLPCPALDPASGLCDLYRWRPVSCRTFGPPVTVGQDRLPPCHFCFTGAPAEIVDACRVAPDQAGLEDEIRDRLEVAGLTSRNTIGAFALATARSD